MDKTVPGAEPRRIRLVFASGEFEVRSALRRVKQLLARRGLDEGDTNTVELVLGEVLNNIVEHAYGPQTPGEITLDCVPVSDALNFRVWDHGSALPGLSLPEGEPPVIDCTLDDLPEGGFGWFLVRSLANELRYGREAGCNRLCFSIPLRPDGGSS